MNAMFFGMPNALFPAFGAVFGNQNVGWLYCGRTRGSAVAQPDFGLDQPLPAPRNDDRLGGGIMGLRHHRVRVVERPCGLALLFLALAGAADMVSGIFRMTLWNRSIPARLRGRTAAIEMVSYSSGPYLGNAEAGFTARLLGLGPSVVAGGVLCILGSCLITWALPAFRNYRAAPADSALIQS